MKRFLWLGFVLSLYLICTGCGETFRPIIIPNPPTFPNPKAAHTVVTINDNGTVAAGSAMVIDVSGDTDVSVHDIGLAPVHAVQQSANEVLVVNHSVPGPQNVGDSLTKLNFNGTVIGSTNTISLPPNSGPNFVAVAPNDTTAYVTLPNYVADPINFPNNNGLAAVNTQSNTLLLPVLTVGNNPVAIAVTPDKSKLYVANNSSPCQNPLTAYFCSISSFDVVHSGNTVNVSPRNGSPVSLSSPPVWLVARNDSQRVYALEHSGVLAALDTAGTSGPDPLTEYPAISVPGAATMVYDGNKNRLYIPGGNQVAVVDISQSAPQYLAGGPITIAPVLSSARTQGDVCAAFSPSSVITTAAAALPDGSRAYVGSYAGFEVDLSITNATLDSDDLHTTYTYTLQPPGTLDLLPGMVVTIANITSTGTNPSIFNGTFQILSVGGGTFQVANSPAATDLYSGGGTGAAPNICPQVTVIDTASNTVKSQIAVPGVAAFNATCSTTRFRITMGAGGDSSRVYLASCDGGNVNIIRTDIDAYYLSLQAPVGARAPIPPSPLNPPQNPVFLIAGP
jgi:hypothetical protein